MPADPERIQSSRDDGTHGRGPGWLPVVLLGGDVLALLAFAALGRNQHHESGGVLSVVETVWPFVAGWVLVAPFRRVLTLDPGRPMQAARDVLGAWPIAWPVALAFRAGVQHRDIPLSFDIVALLTNLLFLVCWRAALAAVLGRRQAAARA